MVRLVLKAKIPKETLKWRKKQKKGAIMGAETFEQIVQETMKKYKISRERAEKIAGKAYWKTAKIKYKERRKNNG